jgi:aconitate hydratase
MVELLGENGVYLLQGTVIIEDKTDLTTEEVDRRLRNAGVRIERLDLDREKARANTMTSRILANHNTSGDPQNLKIKFDALASHDITYVGIIQTARASGLQEFLVPYVLTNCHNSLCAVGGTINEDDHVFGLTAAQKYGGIFVPAHQAVIHQYMREIMTGCGKMLLASDSHTRYGPLGTMGVGEGGPELVKQLLGRTYDLAYPEVIAVYLEGEPTPGVGPQDVALAIIKAVFANGFVKNKVMEFVGPGVENLAVDFRNGIDVMTTETTCLSSIWRTDDRVAEYYRIHGRADAYARLEPGPVSYYDGLVEVDLSRVEPMIALPFHPSNAYSIRELNAHAVEILGDVEAEIRRQVDQPNLEYRLTDKVVKGRLRVDQGVVAGCSGGTFDNILAMAEIIDTASIGNGEFALSVYPASQPINMELVNNGVIARLMTAGVTVRTAFCGPCFGAGDVPANGALSIRHTTRNFPNREGSKPASGQMAAVALMDARSIAATAVNGGILTPGTALQKRESPIAYSFNHQIYDRRVYNGAGRPHPQTELKFGPNIVDWPAMGALTENLLLRVAAVINDPVTTTDELIPSGETSSYRSNPLKLAEFTLSRKEPEYVGRAKQVQNLERERQHWLRDGARGSCPEVLRQWFAAVGTDWGSVDALARTTGLGTVIVARKPGDGSAREQAASCQKVLGGWANFAREYATKRYRSNLINWGMLPFTLALEDIAKITLNAVIFIPGIRQAVASQVEEVPARIITDEGQTVIRLKLANLSHDERAIILAGSLINYYASGVRRDET